MKSLTESFLFKAKTQSKVFVVVFLLWVKSMPYGAEFVKHAYFLDWCIFLTVCSAEVPPFQNG